MVDVQTGNYFWLERESTDCRPLSSGSSCSDPEKQPTTSHRTVSAHLSLFIRADNSTAMFSAGFRAISRQRHAVS